MEHRSKSVKPILEAGLNASIVVVIMLFSVVVPLFSVVGMYLLPIPITILYIRNNVKVTLSAVFVSTILISMFVGPIQALSVSLMYSLTGITLGYCMRKQLRFSSSIILLALATSIGITVPVIISSYFIGNMGITGMINEAILILQESRNAAESFYASIGVGGPQLEQAMGALDAITTELLLYILPGMLVVSALFSAYVNYAVTKSILKKLRYDVIEMTPYSLIYIDNRLGALIIGITSIGIILSTRNIVIGPYISASGIIVLQVIFIISGTAVSAYYLINKIKLKKGLTAVILIFLSFSQLNTILMYIGFADLIFDFRKIDPNRIFKKSDK